MNFLLSQIQPSTTYYSYMQWDDTLPPNYYQRLVDCLEQNLDAVNCYPSTIVYSQKGKPFSTVSNEPSLLGPDYDRVYKITMGK